MPVQPRLRAQPNHRLAFFQGFLERPLQVASFVPSSRFLERRLVRAAGAPSARVIVELGPGTGGTTRALLGAMRPDAQLLAIEINERFAALLDQNPDSRLKVHLGSAAEIRQALQKYELEPPQAVLSGIPFSTMDREVAREVLRAVHDVLAPGGVFVAYQVRNHVGVLGQEVFGPGRMQREVLNVLPVRVYRWEKRSE